jgi:hypothetical protein
MYDLVAIRVWHIDRYGLLPRDPDALFLSDGLDILGRRRVRGQVRLPLKPFLSCLLDGGLCLYRLLKRIWH